MDLGLERCDGELTGVELRVQRHLAEGDAGGVLGLQIERETKANILSDDTLVEMLKAEGIDIARRTVAKYRESLGIPSSVQRRREKNAFGS